MARAPRASRLRIVLGSLTTAPRVLTAAAERLAALGLGDDGLEAACATLRDALGPLTNLYSPAAYKRELARILLRKAVLELQGDAGMKKGFITLHVNGDAHEVVVSSQHTLLDVLRGKLKLMGTKEGCTTGSCGVCTVNNGRGEAVLSCLTPALEWDGAGHHDHRGPGAAMAASRPSSRPSSTTTPSSAASARPA